MPLARIAYEDLPPKVRDRIETTTGTVTAATCADTGLNSAVAATLQTARGRFFVKALPADHRWVWTQAREAEIAPYLQDVAPTLHRRIAGHGWDVLIFEALDGHHADYTPGAADVPLVLDLVARIGHIAAPGLPLRDAPQRLQKYAAPEVLRLFAGSALLHTDWNNTNVIIHAGAARMVDWGWATRGAAWLDTAYLIIWLINAGHTPEAAETLARRNPEYDRAPQAAITGFADVNARLWTDIGGAEPDTWTARMIIATRAWHQFRQTL